MRQQHRSPLLTRRQVLAAGLFAGAAVALNDSTTATTRAVLPTEGGASRVSTPNAAFEHIVVLMMENRSFDQVLGWLYPSGEPRPGQRFEGVAGRSWTNPSLSDVPVPAHRFAGNVDDVLISPAVNAGEGFSHTMRQLWGSHDRDSAPTMDGFVVDYQDHLRSYLHRDPTVAEYAQVMGGFSAGALPVVSTLAEQFGVFDHWFSAVPTDTWPNRAFFHAATSNGFMSNAGGGGYGKWLNAPPVATVFNSLQGAGVP